MLAVVPSKMRHSSFVVKLSLPEETDDEIRLEMNKMKGAEQNGFLSVSKCGIEDQDGSSDSRLLPSQGKHVQLNSTCTRSIAYCIGLLAFPCRIFQLFRLTVMEKCWSQLQYRTISYKDSYSGGDMVVSVLEIN